MLRRVRVTRAGGARPIIRRKKEPSQDEEVREGKSGRGKNRSRREEAYVIARVWMLLVEVVRMWSLCSSQSS